MIQLNSLHKYFNKGRQNEIHVINDVSLELPERGMVAIFGKSGCGKTTLLNVIGGLDGFHAGSLSIEGQDIRRDTDTLRNRYIGYIFQNYNLNKGESCYDNVADALRLCGVTDAEVLDARVTAALRNVGMEKYAKRPPDTLSGGQQQRIAIARAIVKNPRIILADEPTGNLDEANTVMIMDLLKQIAKNHLVLLVTHEANLVDYYCDTVIELADGRVVSVRENIGANGYLAKDKNTVYLGELAKSEQSDGNAEVSYYGDTPKEPIRLKIVNNGGKLYVKIETPGVQVLDEFSEVRLREGVYEQKKQAEDQGQIDMSALPPVEGERFGRLFTFGNSLKSGYAANFKHRKKSKKILRRCMGLFAAVIVFMSAVFGTGIAQWIDADRSYNHNVFYVYTPSDGTVSQKLQEALADPQNGIDYLRLYYGIPTGDMRIGFNTGFFETFQSELYGEGFLTNAVLLDMELGETLPLVEGKKTELATAEAVITTRVADELLEKSSIGYITDYRDLLGLVSNWLTVGGETLRIAGIVDSDEPSIYLSREAMARYVMQGSGTLVKPAADFGITLSPGEALLVSTGEVGRKHPEIGGQVQIHGHTLTLKEKREQCHIYSNWLMDRQISKRARKFDESKAAYYKYYYEELDAFLRDFQALGGDHLDSWLYVEKGIELARFGLLEDDDVYYAWAYESLYGSEPTDAQLNTAKKSLPDYHSAIASARSTYEAEYSRTASNRGIYTDTYLVSTEDYIAISRKNGKTDACASAFGDMTQGVEKAASAEIYDMSAEDVIVESSTGSHVYTVVHSSDPAATAAWLENTLAGASTGVPYLPALLTPNDIFDRLMSDIAEGIIISLITLGAVLILMCLCMYFIMRSSLMNRIKEVGIYRAIGVSKKNLIFKFFVEALVLTTLTVLGGYLLSAIFIALCLGLSSLVSMIFFFPLWYALIVLAVLYAMCLICGTLPILTLLRRTPSEILAKYDI